MAAGGSTKVVLTALACNGGIAIAKFAAAAYTGSSAMLSEAVHSLVAASNQALLLYGLRRAERPADARHPSGSRRELYFWGFIVAVLLYSLGAGVSLYEGVEKLQRPRPIQNPEISYIVLGVALLLLAGSAWVTLTAFNQQRGKAPLLTAGRASRDPSIFVVLLQTIAAMIGLSIAFAGVLVAHIGGIPEADGIAAIAIGLLLGLVAAFAAIEVKSLLMREPAHDGVLSNRPTTEPEAAPAVSAPISPSTIVTTEPTPPAAAASSGAPHGHDKPQLQARYPQTKKARRKRRR